MKRGSLILLAVLLPAALVAGELEGVTLPDTVTVEGKELVLNGLGLREATFLKVDVYVAGLYLESKSSDPKEIIESEQVKRIHMHFVYKKVKPAKLIAAWDEGFENNAGKDLDAVKDRLAKLNSWMTEIVKGQTMVFTYVPGKGTMVEVAGEEKGVIEGDDFARALWSVWFGPEPPNPELKEGMLGG